MALHLKRKGPPDLTREKPRRYYEYALFPPHHPATRVITQPGECLIGGPCKNKVYASAQMHSYTHLCRIKQREKARAEDQPEPDWAFRPLNLSLVLLAVQLGRPKNCLSTVGDVLNEHMTCFWEGPVKRNGADLAPCTFQVHTTLLQERVRRLEVHLRLHQRVHEDEGLHFPCVACSGKHNFSTRKELEVHVNALHRTAKTFRYSFTETTAKAPPFQLYYARKAMTDIGASSLYIRDFEMDFKADWEPPQDGHFLPHFPKCGDAQPAGVSAGDVTSADEDDDLAGPSRHTGPVRKRVAPATSSDSSADEPAPAAQDKDRVQLHRPLRGDSMRQANEQRPTDRVTALEALKESRQRKRGK
ncbi:hypothetical protein JCM3770_003946 [Rhodotorula araucariae]